MLQIDKLPKDPPELCVAPTKSGFWCELVEPYLPECVVSLWCGLHKGKSLIVLYFYRKGYVFIVDGSKVRGYHCQFLSNPNGLSEEQLKLIAMLLAEGKRKQTIVKAIVEGA